jgi:hypothetical protein
MSAGEPITVEALKAAPFDMRHWRRLPRGGFYRADRCMTYPRFTVETRRAEGVHKVTTTYLVDGRIADTLDQVAERLNKPAGALA